jgi:uncharacterized cupin superfamily protein
MLNFRTTQIRTISNEKADYGFIELFQYIDFEVKRVYFFQNCKQVMGNHCHKVEKEFFVLLRGNCTAIIDHGKGVAEYSLKSIGDAIYADNFVWHAFKDFSPDALLLALSSTNHNPDRSDYIDDYEEYKKTILRMKTESQ